MYVSYLHLFRVRNYSHLGYEKREANSHVEVKLPSNVVVKFLPRILGNKDAVSGVRDNPMTSFWQTQLDSYILCVQYCAKSICSYKLKAIETWVRPQLQNHAMTPELAQKYQNHSYLK